MDYYVFNENNCLHKVTDEQLDAAFLIMMCFRKPEEFFHGGIRTMAMSFIVRQPRMKKYGQL